MIFFQVCLKTVWKTHSLPYFSSVFLGFYYDYSRVPLGPVPDAWWCIPITIFLAGISAISKYFIGLNHGLTMVNDMVNNIDIGLIIWLIIFIEPWFVHSLTMVYPLVMTNIAMENPNHKWRFPAGKFIYKWAIFHGYVSHNQRVPWFTIPSSNGLLNPWLQHENPS